MKAVYSLQHYYTLIAEEKNQLGILKTNCALLPESIERYIFLGRFFYEEAQSGLLFFSDEESYYQTYYYLKEGETFCLSKKDKPVLIQNIYREGKENRFLTFLGRELSESGFVLQDTLRHAVLKDSDMLFQSLEKSVQGIERLFTKKGFVFQKVVREQLDELKFFMGTIEQIPFWQYPYYTDEEYVREADAGRLSCILNEDNRIVAARHLIISGKKAYGWVGIDEAYKAFYGFAPYILYKQLVYLRNHNITMCSWVMDTNMPSIQYHNRIGSTWTGQMEDEWLLDADI